MRASRTPVLARMHLVAPVLLAPLLGYLLLKPLTNPQADPPSATESATASSAPVAVAPADSQPSTSSDEAAREAASSATAMRQPVTIHVVAPPDSAVDGDLPLSSSQDLLAAPHERPDDLSAINKTQDEDDNDPSSAPIADELELAAGVDSTIDENPGPTPIEDHADVDVAGEKQDEAVVADELIAPEVDAIRHAALESRVTIENLAHNRLTVGFIIDAETEHLQPGQRRSYPGGPHWSIRFDRGGTFGTERQSLLSGEYQFQVSPQGWSLTPAEPMNRP